MKNRTLSITVFILWCFCIFQLVINWDLRVRVKKLEHPVVTFNFGVSADGTNWTTRVI